MQKEISEVNHMENDERRNEISLKSVRYFREYQILHIELRSYDQHERL